MQRVRIHRPGSYDRLQLEEVPRPRPGPGEVLVRVSHAGVNYADCIVRMGLYESAAKYVGWPITPGFEVAGLVEETGEGVRSVSAGLAVMAVTRFSGYAGWVLVPEHQVFPIPAQWTAEQAAGFPAVALTAHYALHVLCAPSAGAQILVHSAAGGVGSALCQLGRAAGCRVVGIVGGPHKIAAAERAGAHVVIDKSREPLWERVIAACPESNDGYDAVFDANGRETLRGSYRCLRPTGRLVIYGFHSMLPRTGGRPSWLRLAWDYLRTPRFDPLRLTGDNKSVMAFNLSYLFERRELLTGAMRELFVRVAEGHIRPPEVRCYPLADVAAAHRDLESGRTTGKLVLTL